MTRTGVLPRLALAVIAVLLVALLTVWLRDSLLESQAADRVPKLGFKPAPAKVREVLDMFSDATFLNPDSRPRIASSQLLLYLGQPRAAARELQDVVAKEPDNAIAWSQLALVARQFDMSLARRAHARFLALKPPVAK